MESDAISWLNLIYDSTNAFLPMCNSVDDIMQLFQKNKVLFDKVKEVDPETYAKLTGLLTERKTKLEKDAKDGNQS